MAMDKLSVKLYFVREDDVSEVEIVTMKERINDDVGLVMQVMEDKGYCYIRGVLERFGGGIVD